jgi:hypothetical protein
MANICFSLSKAALVALIHRKVTSSLVSSVRGATIGEDEMSIKVREP